MHIPDYNQQVPVYPLMPDEVTGNKYFRVYTGPGTVPDAAARVVKAAMLGPDGPTGQFFSDDNVPETGISPW